MTKSHLVAKEQMTKEINRLIRDTKEHLIIRDLIEHRGLTKGTRQSEIQNERGPVTLCLIGRTSEYQTAPEGKHQQEDHWNRRSEGIRDSAVVPGAWRSGWLTGY